MLVWTIVLQLLFYQSLLADSSHLQNCLVSLRKVLYSQAEYEGLLTAEDKPEGAAGLCGPSCLLGIMKVLDKQSGTVLNRNTDYERLRYLVKWYQSYRKEQKGDYGNPDDLKLLSGIGGLNFKPMVEALLPQFGYNLSSVETIGNGLSRDLELRKFFSGNHEPNSFVIALINSVDSSYGHWVMVTGFEPSNHSVKYIDPNYPLEVRSFQLSNAEYKLNRISNGELKHYWRGESEVTSLVHIVLSSKPPVSLHNAAKWVAPNTGSAPPRMDKTTSTVSKEFVEVRPNWAKPIPRPDMSKMTEAERKDYEAYSKKFPHPDMMMIPNDKIVEFNKLAKEMGDAKLYEDGIFLLRFYLEKTGLIANYKPLILRHATNSDPKSILKDGIFSARELMERGIEVDMKGQNMGDGIYTIGSKDWGENSNWGQNHFLITLPSARVFHGNNKFAGAFVKLYDQYRKKWNFPLPVPDAILIPGLSQSAYSIESLLNGLPSFYEDMEVQAASNSLEILLKKRSIHPSQIEYISGQ